MFVYSECGIQHGPHSTERISHLLLIFADNDDCSIDDSSFTNALGTADFTITGVSIGIILSVNYLDRDDG